MKLSTLANIASNSLDGEATVDVDSGTGLHFKVIVAVNNDGQVQSIARIDDDGSVTPITEPCARTLLSFV